MIEALLLVASLVGADCSLPGRNSPAVPAPECVDASGFGAPCLDGNIRLWPSDMSPASSIPAHRDSTDRVAANTIPGRARGHEIFSSVDIVGTRLYVAYTTGVQVWDIAEDPANPRLVDSVDGWSGEFLDWPNIGEVLEFIEGVSGEANGQNGIDIVAVSGNNPVGISIFEYSVASRALVQVYQHPNVSGRQVRTVELNGRIYVIAGTDEGARLYDATSASEHGPCVEGSIDRPCPEGIYLGFIHNGSARFVDVLKVGESAIIGSSGGYFTTMKIFDLALDIPGNSRLLFDGLHNVQGIALFQNRGHYYAAVIDETDGIDREKLRILLVDKCAIGMQCDVVDAVSPVDMSGYPTSNDFLDFSEGFLYYSFGTGGLFGPGLERIFDVSRLSSTSITILPEIAANGGHYTDPCNGASINYWGHYYSRNTHGLNEMSPRSGKFGPGGRFFYRAAGTILDVHVRKVDTGVIFVDGFESGTTNNWR